MKRTVLLVALLALVGAAIAAPGLGKASKTMTFKVRLIQEATYRTPHPPEGDAGDVFSTSLRLFAIGPLFGKADDAYLGTMSFSYTLRGGCTAAGGSCKGTTNLNTVTKLPGGTLTANGTNIALGKLPYVVPIVSGTGIFAGAKGSISIAPAGAAQDVFKVTLP